MQVRLGSKHRNERSLRSSVLLKWAYFRAASPRVLYSVCAVNILVPLELTSDYWCSYSSYGTGLSRKLGDYLRNWRGDWKSIQALSESWVFGDSFPIPKTVWFRSVRGIGAPILLEPELEADLVLAFLVTMTWNWKKCRLSLIYDLLFPLHSCQHRWFCFI